MPSKEALLVVRSIEHVTSLADDANYIVPRMNGQRLECFHANSHITCSFVFPKRRVAYLFRSHFSVLDDYVVGDPTEHRQCGASVLSYKNVFAVADVPEFFRFLLHSALRIGKGCGLRYQRKTEGSQFIEIRDG